MEWISVKDRTPSIKDRPVMIYIDGWEDETLGIREAYWSGFSFEYDRDHMLIPEPTYWMEFPDPPKSLPIKKKRHKWGKLLNSEYSKFQGCLNCDMFRFKALGIWMYTKDNPRYKPFSDNCINEGCN